MAVIDDDDSVRQALRQLLRTADFDVVTFGSAEEFLRSGERDRAHCLVIDVHLPGMSGVALVQQLLLSGRMMPAMLMTAGDDAMTRELIGRVSSVPYLRKPFSGRDFFAIIDRVLPS